MASEHEFSSGQRLRALVTSLQLNITLRRVLEQWTPTETDPWDQLALDLQRRLCGEVKIINGTRENKNDESKSESKSDGERTSALREAVRQALPELDKAIQAAGRGGNIVWAQAAFAADYSADEMLLLGMAIKYAGLHGVTVNIAA